MFLNVHHPAKSSEKLDSSSSLLVQTEKLAYLASNSQSTPMKNFLLIPAIIALSACQEEQTNTSNSDSESVVPNSTTSQRRKLITGQKGRTITSLRQSDSAENTKIASAKLCAQNLTMACEAFFEVYQALPLATNSTSDTSRKTNELFMRTSGNGDFLG